MRTFIKWMGNKSKHLNKFIQYVPDEYNTYIEPFVGSGSLLLKLEPEKWIINDLNKDLINIWKCVKKDPEEIVSNFKNFGKKFKRMSNDNKVKYCKEITNKLSEMSYDIYRASTYMLMKFCAYMGNIFINEKFYFSGLDKHIYVEKKYPFLKDTNYENIRNVSNFLNNTKGKIYNKDYKYILEKAKDGDFVFLDPPYIEDHKYVFNYNKGEILNNDFLQELLKEVKKLDKRNVKWMMTQADTKEIKRLFKEYKIKKFEVCRGFTNRYTNELVIMNY
jgi:DNA adenine methylase